MNQKMKKLIKQEHHCLNWIQKPVYEQRYKGGVWVVYFHVKKPYYTSSDYRYYHSFKEAQQIYQMNQNRIGKSLKGLSY